MLGGAVGGGEGDGLGGLLQGQLVNWISQVQGQVQKAGILRHKLALGRDGGAGEMWLGEHLWSD